MLSRYPTPTHYQMDINVGVGDGNLALFWKDRWNGADSPCAIAPELSTLVRPRAKKSGTVAAALLDKAL
jgi:hypothetical protein